MNHSSRLSPALLREAARRRDLIRARSTKADEDLPLLDFVPHVSPEFDRPVHLYPFVDALERAQHEPLRICLSTPPQHTKSSTAFHGIAWVLKKSPQRFLYITYNEDFATSQMYEAKDIARRAGVKFVRGNIALREWRLENGGRLYATGIGGSITGRPGGVVIVDDPIKDWVSAQSPRIRDTTDNWFRTSVLTRIHPSTPVIVIATRWHEDDLIGRLIGRGWDWINLKAISDEGEALWPSHRPLDFLEEQRSEAGLGELLFSAMYQGEPRPAGNTVFGPPTLCELKDIPTAGQRAVGVDLSYTAKTKSDWSVRVDLLRHGFGEHERYYVTNVVRRQCRATEFAFELRAAARMYPGAPFRWYAYGPEIGSADFIEAEGVPIDAIPAPGDKFVRSQKFAAPLWNAGKIIVPSDAPWSQPFILEVTRFTGVGDAADDQVDALVAGVDALADKPTATPVRASNPRKSAGLKKAF